MKGLWKHVRTAFTCLLCIMWHVIWTQTRDPPTLKATNDSCLRLILCLFLSRLYAVFGAGASVSWNIPHFYFRCCAPLNDSESFFSSFKRKLTSDETNKAKDTDYSRVGRWQYRGISGLRDAGFSSATYLMTKSHIQLQYSTRVKNGIQTGVATYTLR